MLAHKVLAKATIKNKNGENWKIALVKTNTDYVIASHYYSKKEGWGSGEYFPLTMPLESAYLMFVKRLLVEKKSIFTKEITA